MPAAISGKVVATPTKKKAPVKHVYEATQHDIRQVEVVFRKLPMELLRPGSFQSRRNFEPQKLQELSASLRSSGINITPLVVRPDGLGGGGYQIICGERRWRAAQLADMPELLCCIGDFTDEQALYMCGAENIQREDLNALEEAIAYDLMLQSGMTHAQVALDIGKSRSHVTNYLRLLDLPLTVRDMLEQNKLNFGQARPLCSLPTPGLQVTFAREAVEKKWTAKQVERAVADYQQKRKRPTVSTEPQDCDIDIKRLREIVAAQTGYPCVIMRTKEDRWQLGLSAASIEEFQGILERLGVKTDEL